MPRLECNFPFNRHILKGTVRLIFQPAEEGGAGASYMIKEGALGDATAIFAMHVDYTIPTGSIAALPGPNLAAVSFFEARIEGEGGHAALPHKTVDPVVAASFMILALQQLISREADPLHSQVGFPHILVGSLSLWYFDFSFGWSIYLYVKLLEISDKLIKEEGKGSRIEMAGEQASGGM